MGQALLGGKLTTRARNTVPALFLHGLLVGIIGIGLAQLDDLDTIGIELIEIVTGVGSFVGFDTLFLSAIKIARTHFLGVKLTWNTYHESKILHNGILELLLLIGGVGVIETQQKSAVVLLVGEVVVEKSSLGVSNVQVSRGLGREASDNTAVGVLQSDVVAGTLLRLRGLLLLRGSGQGINGGNGPRAELL